MYKEWVDFSAVKDQVSMQMVLQRYGINWLRKRSSELYGRCPIHKGKGQTSFNVNSSRNVFNCFSCQAHGNVLDFVAAMERCSIKEAALKLKEWFWLAMPNGETQNPLRTKPPEMALPATVRVNRPLRFQLKNIDNKHPYLASRGISRETAETFGLGLYAGTGVMSGRMVIPIHNSKGQLVAYAGRSIDGSEPRYRLPKGFHKSWELFNLHRVTAQEVVLVEGFFDCMKVWQLLHPFVVALMGCSMSKWQEEIITSRFTRVTLFLDGDQSGQRAAENIASRLVHKLQVRIANPSDGRQPDQLVAEEISNLLQTEASLTGR